jgi:integrase
MRGHIRRRGKDSWAVVHYLGRDAVTHKDRHKWRSVRGTKKDAQRELARLLNLVHTGAYVEPAKLTVGDFLDQWLRDCVKPSVASTTFDTYSLVVRHYLGPSLATIRLSKLQPANIQAAIRLLLESGKVKHKGGVAPASALKTVAVLHRACDQAVKWGWLGRNPCDAVDRPRLVPREMQVWTEEETRRFLDEAERTSPHHSLYLTAVATGMRQAELLGLRWQDVDLEAGVAAVRQICYRGVFKEPKTQKARRTVALSSRVIEALRRHKARQNETRLRWGAEYHDRGLVFTQDSGKPLDGRDLVQRDFEPLQKRAGVPRIRFHDLRHSHASHLLRAGVHPKVVSERLGHSRVGITLDVTHMSYRECRRRRRGGWTRSSVLDKTPGGLDGTRGEPAGLRNRIGVDDVHVSRCDLGRRPDDASGPRSVLGAGGDTDGRPPGRRRLSHQSRGGDR